MTKDQKETAETEASTPQATGNKKKHPLRKVGFVCFLVLMGCVFYLAYSITPAIHSVFQPAKKMDVPKLNSITQTKPDIAMPQPSLVEDIKLFPDTPNEFIEVSSLEIFPTQETNTEIIAQFETKKLDSNSVDNTAQEVENIITSSAEAPNNHSVQKEPETISVVTAPYSILKAMKLWDAIKQGDQCRPLLEELVSMPNKTPELDQALMDLLQACLERPVAGQMKQAFQHAKKRAILRIFQNGSPLYIAYLKALPYFVANISMKHPTGDTPIDLLNRLQQAVDTNRPQLVLTLIPELPENVQTVLYDVQQHAKHEAEIHQTFKRLMQALFKQGDNHD